MFHLRWRRRPNVRSSPTQQLHYRPILERLEERCLMSAGYLQTNLVSDLPGLARTTDPNLVNPWGIALSPDGLLRVSDNGSGLSTLYAGNGTDVPPVVTIPPPRGSTATAAPTGVVFNDTSDFVVRAGGESGPSTFIFATEDGTISGWNPHVSRTQAVLAVDNSRSAAVYKGVALGSNAQGNFIFATNFRAGAIDVFDKNFHPAHLAGSFTDATLPPGFAPFGIQNINGDLFVTYALQDAAKHDDVAGPGHGFIDVFDTNGLLIKRFASQGALNSPWGLALAPAQFGEFSTDLLVGNFGDGRINAFDVTTGTFLGQLQDQAGRPITIEGLWGLKFGNGRAGAEANTLFFAAGINHEADGLFGSLQALVAQESTLMLSSVMSTADATLPGSIGPAPATPYRDPVEGLIGAADETLTAAGQPSVWPSTATATLPEPWGRLRIGARPGAWEPAGVADGVTDALANAPAPA